MQAQILNKYILREIWPGFFVTICVLVFIALAARMLPITEMVINRGVYIGHVVMMIVYVLPDIIVFSFPAAILMAVVVAFIRFAADNEIIALKASGISILQILPRVVSFSLLGAAASLAIGLYAVPWGDNSFKDLAFKIAEAQGDLGIKERVFTEPFENVSFYVNSFSGQDKVMRDIFVVDNRDKEISNNIIAQPGIVIYLTEDLFPAVSGANDQKIFGAFRPASTQFYKFPWMNTGCAVPGAEPEIEPDSQPIAGNEKNGEHPVHYEY